MNKETTVEEVNALLNYALRPEAIEEWMNTPNDCLGNKAPKEFMSTPANRERLANFLAAMVYGFPS